MQRNILTGSEFLLYNIDNEPVGYSTNCAIKINNNLTNVTTKSSDSWSEFMVGLKDWAIEFEGLVSYGDSFNSTYFINKFKNSEPFFIKFGVVQDNFTHAFFGEVHIESIDQTANDGEIATYSGSLKGIGNLTFTDEGSPEQSGYLKTETDPVFRGSPAFNITDADKVKWHAAHDKIVKEIGFVTNGNTTTLKLKFNDGNIYSAPFENPTANVDLSGYYNKSQTDAMIAATQVAVDNANTLLNNIANDNKLTPNEKINVLKEWQIIQDEKPVLVQQAVTYELETINYDVAYNELDLYLEPLLLSMVTTSNIEGFELRNYFRSYYDQKLLLSKAVNEAQKLYTDDSIDKINIGGRNYHFNGDQIITISGSTNQVLQSGNYPADSQLAISFYAKSIEGINRLNLEFDGEEGKEFFITNTWARYTCVINSGTFPTLYGRLKAVNIFPYKLPFGFDSAKSNSVEIKNLMVTLGNRPMDFVHAPEDFLELINQAKLDAENAAKVYTDAQDLVTKAYADALLDGVIDDIEQINLDLLEDNLQAAKDYADAQALNAKVLANAYSDGLVTDFEQQIIDASNANLLAAKEYTDTQRAASEIVTNAYADGIISDVESELIDNANNNLVAAKQYADAQDLVTKTLSDAYADGKISIEEQNRIDSVQSALDAAKDYTEAQRALSEIVVKAYSDGIVDSEEARAIADAQSKLDLAKSYADQKVDDIAIGGRNYFRKSTTISGYDGLVGVQHVIDGAGVDGLPVKNGIKSVGSNDGVGNGTLRIYNVITGNGQWTVSGYMRLNGSVNINVDICDLGLTSVLYETPNEWKYFSVTVNVSNYGDGSVYNFVDFSGIPWLYFSLQDLKIERGNRATDWTPAPEDVDQSIVDKANEIIANTTNDISIANLATLQSANIEAQNKADAARDAAIISANNYTAAQKLLAEQTAAAYADGIVTTEENARITQAANNLQAAFQDSTNKADAAAQYGIAAQNLHSALVANLGNLSYENFVELSALGNTIIQDGKIITTLLDAVAVRAAIILVGKITADEIDVDSLIVKSIRTAISGQRIEILSSNNNMVFYDSDGHETFRLDDNIDSSQSGEPLGGISMTKYGTSDTSYATANGFFSNGSGMQFLAGSSGIDTNASLVGLLRYRNADTNGYSAAVVGIDSTSSGNSKSYAGFFGGKVRTDGNLEVNGGLSINGSAGISTTHRVAGYTPGGLKRIHQATYVNGILTSYFDIGVSW